MLAVAAAACGADVEQADPELAAPPAQTTAPPPTTEAVSTAPAEVSAPAATTEPPAAAATTAPPTTEPLGPPHVIVWSSPRLNGTTLSASWQVTPGDSNCSFDLLNDTGEVIGTGVPQVADASPDGRGMRADYDPASADALGAVDIRCSRLGGPETVVTSGVHRVTYKNRSPDSVLPATDEYYFDHDEVAALFPECRPPEWLDQMRDWERPDYWVFGARIPFDDMAEHIVDRVIRDLDADVRMAEAGILPPDAEWVDDPDEGRIAVYPNPTPWDFSVSRDKESGRLGSDHHVWLDARLNFWQHAVYENWDTELTAVPLSGRAADANGVPGAEVASGWWTDRQFRMMFPGEGLTVEEVRSEVVYKQEWDYLSYSQSRGLRPNADWFLVPEIYGLVDGYGVYTYLPHLYMRLSEAVGYHKVHGVHTSFDEIGQWIRDDGIAGDGLPNPDDVRPFYLLWDWVDARYSFEPIDREPTAWAMRTLLEKRGHTCVANEMRSHCRRVHRYGDFHPSPHMRQPSQGGSRLGAALWSIVCPEYGPDTP